MKTRSVYWPFQPKKSRSFCFFAFWGSMKRRKKEGLIFGQMCNSRYNAFTSARCNIFNFFYQHPLTPCLQYRPRFSGCSRSGVESCLLSPTRREQLFRSKVVFLLCGVASWLYWVGPVISSLKSNKNVC